MEKENSKISFNYETIKLTKSRIDKGLLALPVSLIDKFPKFKTKIKVFLNDDLKCNEKNFTPYLSSSRECRIGGLNNWFISQHFKDGDEIVIIFLDEEKKKYRFVKENKFIKYIQNIEKRIELSNKEEETENNLDKLSKITNLAKKEILLNQYLFNINKPLENRKINIIKPSMVKENVPNGIRKILEFIYKGKCQLTNFTFIQKNGRPYFEIHHLKSNLGNHFKNLLVVSPNIHAQFTFSKCEEYFDNEGWIRKVKFNNKEYSVNHIIDKITKINFSKTTHF